MSYQVIARKWRPQKFDDVVGQQAVTRTLRNALASGRLAQAFVFAGPRGVGKTTTARILARALNCVNGPTPDPCGVCDACVEIAEGRDIDVLEIDAATHTGVDNVREVIIAGLVDRAGAQPLQGLHHRRSPPALEPVVQRAAEVDRGAAAARRLHDGDDRAREDSRDGAVALAGLRVPDHQHRRRSPSSCASIVDAERHRGRRRRRCSCIARDAEGSMRDAQSKLDQVIAFTGKTITADDVATVLGLVGRDLLLDTLQAVADEDAPAAFALAGRAVEMGYDLRAVCRELSRVVRDLLVLSVDPSRISDPEIAGEGERERLKALVAPLLARGSAARVRSADAGRGRHPRRGAAALSPRDGAAAVDAPAQAGADRGSDCRRGSRTANGRRRRPPPCAPARRERPRPRRQPAGGRAAAPASPPVVSRVRRQSLHRLRPAPSRAPRLHAAAPAPRRSRRRSAGSFKDALLAEIRKCEAGVLQHGRRAGAEDRGRRPTA